MISFYPLLVAFAAVTIAQVSKPVLYYLVYKEWDSSLLTASGGLPSSHSAVVCAAATTVGLLEGFNSTIFSITIVFSMIVMYDAANVRYYAGRNIQLTRKLIDDLKKSDLYIKKLTDPIYDEKIKEILGHKNFEVFTGAILGTAVALLSHLLFT